MSMQLCGHTIGVPWPALGHYFRQYQCVQFELRAACPSQLADESHGAVKIVGSLAVSMPLPVLQGRIPALAPLFPRPRRNDGWEDRVLYHFGSATVAVIDVDMLLDTLAISTSSPESP